MRDILSLEFLQLHLWVQNISHVGFRVDIPKARSVYFGTALPADEDPIILPSTESLAFIGLFFCGYGFITYSSTAPILVLYMSPKCRSVFFNADRLLSLNYDVDDSVVRRYKA